MKKVFQKLIDKNKGDCMQAAVASLLSLEYDLVPRFVEFTEGWFAPLHNLITEHGYKWKGMLHNPYFNDGDEEKIYDKSHVKMLHKYNGVNGFFYAAVYSPGFFNPREFNKGRATTHAVIIDKEYNIVHDPNPENKPGTKYPMADELGFNGIIHITLIET